jgi:hypothetical protein
MTCSFADRQTQAVWNARLAKRLPKAIPVDGRRKPQLIHSMGITPYRLAKETGMPPIGSRLMSPWPPAPAARLAP